MRAYNRLSLDFTYQNISGNNNPILIKKDEIQNKITYEKMVLAKDYKNLLETLKRFKNVYLFDEASFFDGYYIARKIEEPSFSPAVNFKNRCTNFLTKTFLKLRITDRHWRIFWLNE